MNPVRATASTPRNSRLSRHHNPIQNEQQDADQTRRCTKDWHDITEDPGNIGTAATPPKDWRAPGDAPKELVRPRVMEPTQPPGRTGTIDIEKGFHPHAKTEVSVGIITDMTHRVGGWVASREHLPPEPPQGWGPLSE